MIKLSLFFLKLDFLESVRPGLEAGVEDGDPDKYGFFGVVGGEENVDGVTGVVGRVGVLTLTGVDGGCFAGSAFTTPLLVPLGRGTSSGLGSFFSSSFFSSSFFSASSFFSERRVLEEEVPVEAFLGLLIGRV